MAAVLLLVLSDAYAREQQAAESVVSRVHVPFPNLKETKQRSPRPTRWALVAASARAAPHSNRAGRGRPVRRTGRRAAGSAAVSMRAFASSLEPRAIRNSPTSTVIAPGFAARQHLI